MHLTLNLRDLQEHLGHYEHAQAAMRRLGIEYQDATPQSIADCWWFWNCKNVPDPLPPYLRSLQIKAREAIGRGLTAEEAQKIEAKEAP